MGNCYPKLTHCFNSKTNKNDDSSDDRYDDSHGHSFAYLRPSSPPQHTTTFHSISGASVSANVSTPLTTALLSDPLPISTSSAAFESSNSFSAIPLQLCSDRGFLSGPIERGFMSGPLDSRAALFSGPLDKPSQSSFSGQLKRSFSNGLSKNRPRSILRGLAKAISRTVAPPRTANELRDAEFGVSGLTAGGWTDSIEGVDGGVQWAQGKAGEDRVHVVVSEEQGWVFVGIYDGFNGPDATDYLLYNLYDAVHRELNGLLWDDDGNALGMPVDDNVDCGTPDEFCTVGELSCSETNGCCREGKQVLSKRRKRRGTAKIGNWEKKISEIDRKLKGRSGTDGSAKHLGVLKALCRALKKTEETYFDIADEMASENPELALMGSCVLVMLMKGDDVYLMNVGDSRAILAQQMDSDVWRKTKHDLKKINEEAANELEINDPFLGLSNLESLQLTLDHSTCIEEEVRRIRKEHPDDSMAIENDRVKGSLKVTRAFGAGFLKQPKWNDVLLEMFRIDYVGTSPYLTCNPFLYHHKLGQKDKFLILSSDGLYQYITNEEAVSQVEIFMSMTPEGDPAQHLVEEVLFRAAKRAGMDFHELLEVPQGDRRRYHDDISIIIISLEGRIWRSYL